MIPDEMSTQIWKQSFQYGLHKRSQKSILT